MVALTKVVAPLIFLFAAQRVTGFFIIAIIAEMIEVAVEAAIEGAVEATVEGAADAADSASDSIAAAGRQGAEEAMKKTGKKVSEKELKKAEEKAQNKLPPKIPPPDTYHAQPCINDVFAPKAKKLKAHHKHKKTTIKNIPASCIPMIEAWNKAPANVKDVQVNGVVSTVADKGKTDAVFEGGNGHGFPEAILTKNKKEIEKDAQNLAPAGSKPAAPAKAATAPPKPEKESKKDKKKGKKKDKAKARNVPEAGAHPYDYPSAPSLAKLRPRLRESYFSRVELGVGLRD